MQLTDQEVLQDAILAHKFMLDMYNRFGLECSTPELRNLFQQNHAETSKHAYEIFKEMEKRGFYPVTEAKTQDIQQAIQMQTQTQTEVKQKIKK